MSTRDAAFAAAMIVALSPAGAAGPSGEAVFQRCAMCHTIDKGASNGIGPNLFGVAGRKAGTMAGYPYSKALKTSGIVWTPAMLSQWVAKPGKLVPGTKMTFAGLTSKDDIASVVAYLVKRK